MSIIKNNYKKILFIIALTYLISIFISQQKTLNAYNAEVASYDSKIQEEQENNKELKELKVNLNSTEYIEKVAREKLGMYLPNERVYIDIAK